MAVGLGFCGIGSALSVHFHRICCRWKNEKAFSSWTAGR